MDYIVGFTVFTFLSILGEYILLSIIDNSDDPGIKKSLRKVSKVLFIFLIIFYILLSVFFCIVAFSNFQSGQIKTGIKMLITTILLVVGIYYLFIRKIILKISNNKKE